MLAALTRHALLTLLTTLAKYFNARTSMFGLKVSPKKGEQFSANFLCASMCLDLS